MAEQRRRTKLIDSAEWERKSAAAPAARADDTTVISGGRRATLAEIKAHIAAYEAGQLDDG